MTTDRNLLFAVLAYQAGLIERPQLTEACAAWSKREPLAPWLLERGWIQQADQVHLDYLLDRNLDKHSGDLQASMGTLASQGARGSFHEAAIPEFHESISDLALRKFTNSTINHSPGTMATDGSLGPGQRYSTIRMHAKGGIGQVWLARDNNLGRDVALKELQGDSGGDPKIATRFVLEAQLTGQLEHPGIVPVYELAKKPDGHPFYVMRFVKGRTLSQAIKDYQRRRNEGRAAALDLQGLLTTFVAVCNAVAYAHSRGVIHRDLKGQNVVLGDFGEVIVLDWGLAKVIGCTEEHTGNTVDLVDVAPSEQTIAGQILGTPAYMAPEQAAGRTEAIDRRTDVYGLGSILFELLTGRPPHQGANAYETLNGILDKPTPQARALVASVPSALDAVCSKAMAKDPAERYQRATELAEDVRRYLADEPVGAWREPWTVKARRWISRRRTLVTGAASAVLVATLALAVATGMLTAAYDREHKQKEKAEHNYLLARKAVDRFHTDVSEDVLLNEPGLEPLRKKLLQAASDFYKQFVEERRHDRGVQGELGKTLVRLAQITGDIDSPEKAMELDRQAVDIFQNLIAGKPAESAYWSDLAHSLQDLGHLSRITDQLADAEKAYQNALDSWEKLAKRFPDDADTQAGLATSLHGMATVYQVTRRFQEAQNRYVRALSIRENLTAAHPGNDGWQRELAVTQHNLGMVYKALDQRDQAENAYRLAMKTQQQLVIKEARVSKYKNDLARTHYNLGDLYFSWGKTNPADAAYEKAADIWKELNRNHPAVIGFQINLADAYSSRAKMLRSAKQFAKAEEVCHEALVLRQNLAGAHPKIQTYQADLARGYYQMGLAYQASGKKTDAESAFENAIRIQEQLPTSLPGVPHVQSDLARSLDRLGTLLLLEKKLPEAEKSYRQALVLWQKLAREHAEEPEFALNLGNCYANLGNQAKAANKWEDARSWYGHAINVLEKKRPGAELRNALWKRAQILVAQEKYPEAIRDWDRTIELALPADKIWFRLYRTETLARSGQHDAAVAAAEELAPKAARSAEALCRLACAFALSSAAASKDKRADLVERYQSRAIELLIQAEAAGYFKTPTNRTRLRDPDLTSIRARPEFKKILESVGPP